MHLIPDHSFVSVDSLGIAVPPSGMGRDIKTDEEINKVIIGCGACVLYRRVTLEDIKVNDEYFDEDFFVYCEDTDLGMRTILRGWYIAQNYNAYINHLHSAVMGKASGYIQLLGHRNNILVVIKNWPTKLLIKKLPIILFMQLASIGLYCARLKPHLILKLKWEAIKLLPKMLVKRKTIQNRIKNDLEPYLT
jgi:GT2 family glycosyltransferase